MCTIIMQYQIIILSIAGSRGGGKGGGGVDGGICQKVIDRPPPPNQNGFLIFVCVFFLLKFVFGISLSARIGNVLALSFLWIFFAWQHGERDPNSRSCLTSLHFSLHFFRFLSPPNPTFKTLVLSLADSKCLLAYEFNKYETWHYFCLEWEDGESTKEQTTFTTDPAVPGGGGTDILNWRGCAAAKLGAKERPM